MTIDVEFEDLTVGEIDGFMTFVHTPANPIFTMPGEQVILKPQLNGIWQTLRMQRPSPYVVIGLVIAAVGVAISIYEETDTGTEPKHSEERRKRRRQRTQQCVQMLSGIVRNAMNRVEHGAMVDRALRGEYEKRHVVRRTSRQNAGRSKS